jgi:hypothetical protein
MEPALNEQVPQFLDVHERAFDHSTPLGPPREIARDAIEVQQRDLTTYDALVVGGER